MAHAGAAADIVATVSPPAVVVAVFTVGLLQSLWFIKKKPYSKTCVWQSPVQHMPHWIYLAAIGRVETSVVNYCSTHVYLLAGMLTGI